MAVETFSDGIPPEVAPVRPGEELPWERLKTYVSPLLGVTGPMTVMQFPNGSANLTYLLTFGNQQFVLRRPPFGAIAPGAHDMKREYRCCHVCGASSIVRRRVVRFLRRPRRGRK